MRGDKNMGVFETIFRKPKADLKAEGYFKMLNGYTPVFSNAPESIYEMELTRAAIHSFASFASKLKPEISGTAQKNLERTLQFKPNPFMDTSKFIYRIATILSVNNTCFIVPIEDEFGGLIGYYPLLPQRCEVVEYNGAPFLRYTFGSGQKAAIEFERVGVMTQFQYTDDFFGESNAALRPTMQLIHTQNQGIINGVKNSASIRFLAKVANNQPPVISGSNADLGIKRADFTYQYSVTDPDGDTVNVVEKIDGKTIATKNAIALGATQTLSVSGNTFTALTNAKHTITITATDSAGNSAVRTLTFTKSIAGFVITLSAPLEANSQPTRANIKVTRDIPAGGTFKVEATNNPFDASPVWEDCTNAVVQGVAHVFTNKINTAARYGMNIRVTVQRGDALTACWVSGIGGNFE